MFISDVLCSRFVLSISIPRIRTTISAPGARHYSNPHSAASDTFPGSLIAPVASLDTNSFPEFPENGKKKRSNTFRACVKSTESNCSAAVATVTCCGFEHLQHLVSLNDPRLRVLAN